MPRPIPKKKYTALPNEITGTYHNDDIFDKWFVILIEVSVIVFAVLALILIIGEKSGVTSLIFGTV